MSHRLVGPHGQMLFVCDGRSSAVLDSECNVYEFGVRVFENLKFLLCFYLSLSLYTKRGWMFQPTSQLEINMVLRFASPTFWIGYYQTNIVI